MRADRRWLLLVARAGFAVGALLRLRAFLADRPLWLDEASLAVPLIELPARELVQPTIGGQQMAPTLFALAEKLIISVIGTSEQALRLLPLLAGLATLGLIYPVARRFVGSRAAVLVVWFAALSPSLIYYSDEVKQYSTDVVVALILLLLSHRATQSPRPRDWVAFATVGAVAVWLSYPAALVLAAAGLTLFVHYLRRGDRRNAATTAGTAAIWLASFAIQYWLLLRHQVADETMQYYWQFAFAPFPPLALADLQWWYAQAIRFFWFPVGFQATGIALLAFTVGAYEWFKRDRRHLLALAIGPLLVTLAASAAHLYPFRSRLILFLVPGALFVIARGVVTIFGASRPTGVLMAVFLLAGPAWVAPANRAPHEAHDLRSPLGEVEGLRQPGDTFIVHYLAASQLQYYRQRGVTGIAEYETFDGPGRRFGAELQRLSEIVPDSGRFWVVFNPTSHPARIPEQRRMLRRAEDLGQRVRDVTGPGGSAVLFTVSGDDEEGDQQ